jgi:hypothetical protein
VAEYVDAHDASLLREFHRVHSGLVGRVLPPGGTIVAMKFEPRDSIVDKGHRVQDLEEALDKLDVEICYCSTLDDCWMTGGFNSTPVKECPLARLTFQD